MVAEPDDKQESVKASCSLAKISMVAELWVAFLVLIQSCSLAKISMVAEQSLLVWQTFYCCSLAKISMVAELVYMLFYL